MAELAHEYLEHSASIEALLAREDELGLADQFNQLDAILDSTIVAALSGERILETKVRHEGPSLLRLTSASRSQREWLNAEYTKSAHEARGSWYLSETLKVNAGAFVLVEALTDQPRFATSVITSHGAEASSAVGEAVFVWAALDPLFDTLALPLILRSRQAGTKKPEDAKRAWTRVDSLFEALGPPESEAVAAFRRDADWVHASSNDHIQRRLALGEVLRASAQPGIGRRYRAWVLQQLIQRYAAKAKKERPTKAQVLRRADERVLTMLFAGDWLAFLAYLGERPAEGEEMVTALPEPKLFVSGGNAATVAASVGVPSEEVERILGALFGGGEAISPIKQREQALRRLWDGLDQLFSSQEPSMLEPGPYPLAEDWGDEVDDYLDLGWETRNFLEELRESTLAREASEWQSDTVRLPAELVREVETLWATETIERYPQRLATSLHPWRVAQEALGPARVFWEGLLVRLWQNFEEDYDPRTVAFLGAHFREQRREFAALGFPIDESLFERLIEAEHTLSPVQEIVDENAAESVHSIGGLEFRITYSFGPSNRRRPGFTRMRDIVTDYRRAWAEKHLDAYLERLWQDDLRAAAHQINRYLAEKGKPPTARQLSAMTADAATRWCGGQIGLLCAAIGEKDTIHQTYERRVPFERRLFLRRVFAALGGEVAQRIDYQVDDEETQRAKQESANRQRGIGVLTIAALRVLQLEEVLGVPPTLRQYGTAAFRSYAERIWPGEPVEELWSRYLAAVQRAFAGDLEPAELPSPRTSRPPVTLRDVEPEPEPESEPEVALPTDEKDGHPGLVSRLLGRSMRSEDAPTPPDDEASQTYPLQSEGRSDVVGESYYQEALQATRNLVRYDRGLGLEMFDAFLVPEPDNPHDAKAIAVYSRCGKIGHTPRGSLWVEVLSRLKEAGYAKASCRAWLIGGTEGTYLGAVICGDPDEELTYFPT